MHTLDSHLHRGVLHVLFEAMPFDSCTRARQAIKWQRHYRRRTKLDLTFSLGVGRKIVSGIVERVWGGGGLLFQAPSLTLDKTRFMKITKCKVGKRSGCMNTVEAGSALPSGHSACHGPPWQDVRVAGMENSPPDF